VSINKNLTGAALDYDDTPSGILGRYRPTVAHEAAHVIVHRCLFAYNPDQVRSSGEKFEKTNPLMRRPTPTAMSQA